VNVAFFDKTGTLTKQGMDFINTSVVGDGVAAARVNLGMAVCHTLITINGGEIIGTQVDKVSFQSTGALLQHKKGEPMRIIHREKSYTALKQYEFDHHRVTQSVVIVDEHGEMLVFVKGSPEAIKARCVASTLPDGFDESVKDSAKSGVYQIAIAFRVFDLKSSLGDLLRDDVETNLSFGGFINFRNMIRQDTPDVIRELEDGDVTTAMITGDNVLTGICIAREAGMIKTNRTVVLGRRTTNGEIEWRDVDGDFVVDAPSATSMSGSAVDLAMTGEVWAMICANDPDYAREIAKHVRVFGRCNPSDKVSVVANFVESGFTTLMCGDGQNDCGSLKAAHIGVALSSSEASVVAPFTSLDKSITAVSEVLREGRCALASALAVYSYYIIYGQTESLLQTINAYLSITFSEWCWVFMDGIWSVTMAFSLPLAKAARRLSPRRPTASLLGPRTMLSVCGILAWNILFLMIALTTLWNQDWFQCRKWDSNDVSNLLTIGDNYESSVLFLVGVYQYISSAMALNYGYTFREGWWKNRLFVFLALLWSAFVFVMTIYPSRFSCIWRVNCDNEVSWCTRSPLGFRMMFVAHLCHTFLQHAVRWVTSKYPVAINNPFNTTVMPVEFRWKLVAIMSANLVTILAW
jgi:magnesium-transporting ATPase (P-type)